MSKNMYTNEELKKLKSNFDEVGFVILRNFFSQNQVERFTESVLNFKRNDIFIEDEGFTIPDGISHFEEFWGLIVDERLIQLLRFVLGNEVRYIRHSEIAIDYTNTGRYINFESLIGWHRDHRFRAFSTKYFGISVFDESEDPFKIAKIGVYLNSTSENKSPTVFYPKSHLDKYNVSYFEYYFHRCLRYAQTFLKRNKNLVNLPIVRKFPFFLSPTVDPIDVVVEKGDAILFDPRIIHTGTPRSGPRKILWWDYGLENAHTYDYCNYWERERKDMYYGKKPMNTELKELLIRNDLYLKGFENYKELPLTTSDAPSGKRGKMSKFNKLLKIFS